MLAYGKELVGALEEGLAAGNAHYPWNIACYMNACPIYHNASMKCVHATWGATGDRGIPTTTLQRPRAEPYMTICPTHTCMSGCKELDTLMNLPITDYTAYLEAMFRNHAAPFTR